MKSSLRSDYLINFAFSLIKPLGALWLIKVASVNLLPVYLGLFLFSRRFSNTAAALLQMGISQTLIRYLSVYHDDSAKKRRYVIFAVLCMTLLIILISIVVFCVAERDDVYDLVFSNAAEVDSLLLWTFALLYSYMFSFIAIALMLAERNIIIFNAIQLLTNSVIPLALLFLVQSNSNVIFLIKYQAISFFLLSLAAMVYFFFKLRPCGQSCVGWRKVSSDFVFYGVPRGFISALDMALFFIGPWLVKDHIEQAGYFIISLVVLKLVQSIVLPIGQLSGVVVGKLSSSKRDDNSIREGFRILFVSIVVATSILSAGVLPWISFLLEIWLGYDVGGQVYKYLYILMWGIVPYAVYQGFISIVDILWKRPFNLYILSAGMLLYVVLFFILNIVFGDELAVAKAFLITIWFVGGMVAMIIWPYLGGLAGFGVYRFLLTVSGIYFVNYVLSVNAELVYMISAICITTALVYIYAFIRPSPLVKIVLSRLMGRAVAINGGS